MTILVLSDSHGKVDRISEAIERAGRVDYILFLGDRVRDVELLATEAPIISVSGNCDAFGSIFGDEYPEERTLNLGGYNILMMHGHTASVKYGDLRAIEKAVAADADILVYGHTHLRRNEYLPAESELGGVTLKKPLYLFNPGSVGQPREGAPSFGVMTLCESGILLSHGELD